MLVMLSGGRDSVCLLHKLRWPAMHMNYGLRAEADEDEAFCRSLCRDLGLPLTVVRPESAPGGNLQAWAREERYAAALALTDGDVAVGHTASDQAETFLYRLLSSPGRPKSMAPRRGRIVRPLLAMTRAETTAYCVAHGLSWRDDRSNDSGDYARNRVRALLRDIHPAAERNVLRTMDLLSQEGDLLASLVEPETSVSVLRGMHPVLLRLTLQRMADDAGGRVAIRDVERVLRGADLGGGLRSVVEHGHIRFSTHGGGPPNAPATLTVPGRIRWGEAVLSAELSGLPSGPGTLDRAALGAELQVRTWRAGDRMRPLGMHGHSKSLQDLFTDRKIPRERRHQLPVVLADGEIAWIPGVATSETYKATGGPTVRLSWN